MKDPVLFKNRSIVKPDDDVSLDSFDPGETFFCEEKKEARKALKKIHKKLESLQELLYAGRQKALLMVFQATDTGGKDGTIRKVFGPLNPQGVRVSNFKQPSAEEMAHDYLWRIHKSVPAYGMIGIFNRSHYESVLVERVHQLAPLSEIENRYEEINWFEKFLSDNGVVILKFFLHISREEQKKRLQKRLDNSEKHWKFSKSDLSERKLWDDYIQAYQWLLARCSTESAPWFVVPANHKWYRDLVVGSVALNAMQSLSLSFPPAEEGLDKVKIPD